MQKSTTPGELPPEGPVQDKPYPNRLRNLAAVCLTFFVIGFVGFFSLVTYQIAARDMAGQSAPNGISVFWAAAWIALEGPPVAAFDVETLDRARNLPSWVPERGRQMAITSGSPIYLTTDTPTRRPTSSFAPR